MNWLIKQIREEPVLFQGVIQALLALGLSFGLKLKADQVGGILAATAAILAFVTRQQVTPLVNPRDNTGKSLT